MASGHVHRLRLRLFLEGVEVPVIAATLQCSPNGPSVASIQVPPLAEGTRLHPRTVVHLFFYDMYTATSPFIETQAKQGDGKNDPTNADKQQTDGDPGTSMNDASNRMSDEDGALRNYKLLFVGELSGFQWTKNVRHRSLVLQCVDLSNYWDYAYQWTNTGLFGPGFKAVFSGGSTNLFTDFLTTKGSVITSIVVSGKCNAFPKLKGLAAGIIRLIEAIGGTYFPRPGSEAKKIRGQNLFFSMAELRLRITQMVGAVENDTTSTNIIARQGYSGMFDRALGGLGSQTSIRQAINALTKIVFHETYPQPCPKFVPGADGAVSGVKRTKVQGHPQWGYLTTEAEQAIEGINALKASLTALENEAELLTASGVGTRGVLRSLQDKAGKLSKRLRQVVARMRGKGTPPPQASAIFAKSAQLVGTGGVQLNQWRPKGPASVKSRIIKSFDDALSQLEKARDLTVNETAAKDVQPARLLQQILRPDVWFTAPPRCNVLFPEAYDTLQYQRAFFQEPTRFLLKTNDEFFGEDALFDSHYFAPQAGTVRGEGARLQNMLAGALLDHELFTGILPIFEKMGEFNVFANRSGTVQAKGGVTKAGPAQRSANFLYFKHRFNARSIMVEGKFNPWVAVGFPGLVIDKYVDVETIKLHNELRLSAKDLGLTEQEVGAVLGTNYLANFTSVVHMVSQQESKGMTQIQGGFARQAEEGIEFLGAAQDALAIKKREGEAAVRSTDIAAVNSPKLSSFGPNYGKIINVQEVTSEYARASAQSEFFGADELFDKGKKLPLFDVQTTPKKRGQKPVLVPVGVTMTAQQYGPEVEEITGNADSLVRMKAYRVTEEVPRYRQEDAFVPIEEFIRPGWYGDVWTTAKIGKVYEEFFDIGSITDAQTFVDPTGAAKGKQSEQAHDAAAEGAKAEDSDDPRKDAPSALALDEGATVQAAVEFLWLTYSYIKQQGIDIEEFIRAYTWRPVATMVDMFGTSNLQFDQTGEKVLDGVEGFHSRAFGPYDNLFGLVGPAVEDILGVKRGEQSAQKADTRKRKLLKVQEYVSALRFSRAILG